MSFSIINRCKLVQSLKAERSIDVTVDGTTISVNNLQSLNASLSISFNSDGKCILDKFIQFWKQSHPKDVILSHKTTSCNRIQFLKQWDGIYSTFSTTTFVNRLHESNKLLLISVTVDGITNDSNLHPLNKSYCHSFKLSGSLIDVNPIHFSKQLPCIS